MPVEFPAFKPIELADRDLIQDRLWAYQPETSELTFTNLFIWRIHYGAMWSLYRDWLLFVFDKPGATYALPPIGPPSRQEVTWRLLQWLKDKGKSEPRLERADQRLVTELAGSGDFLVEPRRDHFDYVYRSQDLIELAGRKYHAKRNYINTFVKKNEFSYEAMAENHLPACVALADRWCEWHRCEEDMNLIGERSAVLESLANFGALKIKGGVIRVNGEVEAFALGEMLNSQTAVVHIEKANPEIRGLYSVINQQFPEHNWREAAFINREQDLGEPQLRETKLSYFPHHMVEKFHVRLRP
ncbi:MAG: phosphatidylglycerol lysyltransferase domain-containing protein [Chloroflexota bacterium]|nr:phosphatidylglycerol lysyltransferase domain-containing protein [Chloroflexota bacterium]